MNATNSREEPRQFRRRVSDISLSVSGEYAHLSWQTDGCLFGIWSYRCNEDTTAPAITRLLEIFADSCERAQFDALTKGGGQNAPAL